MSVTSITDLESKIQFLSPENSKNTQNVIKACSYKDNSEICTQSLILANLTARFNDIQGVSATLGMSVKAKGSNKGGEDGTIRVQIDPSVTGDNFTQTLYLGAEVKRTSTKTVGTDETKIKNMCLVQSIAYFQNGRYTSIGLNKPYDLYFAICDNFVAILYYKDNRELCNNISDYIDTLEESACNLYKNNSYRFDEMCKRLIWEKRYYIDTNFNFTDIVSKILKDLVIWK